jgi:hypothetical protein
MKRRLLAVLGSLVTSAGLALGQGVDSTLTSGDKAAPAAAPASAPTGAALAAPHWDGGHGHDWAPGGGDNCGPRCWFGGEYLLWWCKDAPLGVPLATVATPGVATGGKVLGAIGTPGTVILSPDHLDLGTFSGFRVTGGCWLDDDATMGVEVNGFWLPHQSASFGVASPPGGTTVFVPFLNAAHVPPVESALPFGAIGATSGSIDVRDRLELWGAEANLLLGLANEEDFTLAALAGFRYLDLRETLDIDLLGVGTGFTTFSNDHFRCRNSFYGGNLGLRGETCMNGFFVNVTAECALGDVTETVTATGFATLTTAAGSVTVPGGFFVQNSNAGVFRINRFAVVPEVRTQVGYNVSDNLRVYVGYDFLYLSDCLRPGDQIDHAINFTQQAAPIGGGHLVGPAAPLPLLSHSDFWAQGVNFGVTLRF